MELDPTTYGLGDTVTFTIEVLNQGSLDATEVQISDYVPMGLILVTGEGWTMTGDTARLDTPIATIESGSTAMVEIRFVIDPTTTLTEITNNAEIESAENILGAPDVDSPDYGDQDGSTPDPLDDDTAATDGSDDYDPATIELSPYVSLGSTVFSDANNDGQFDELTESGLSGVTVSLYADEDMDGIADGSALATVLTDAMGNYLFDSLLVGDYVVGVTPLDSLPLSSTPTNTADDQTDNDDNGIQASSGDEIFSPSINLSGDAEPAGETGQGGMQDAANDTDGDMTVDFGLYGVYDLAIDKSFNSSSTDPIAQGSTVTFDVTVTNEGTLEAFNVSVIDNIPMGLTLADPNWTLTNDTATLNTPISSIASGESSTVSITFTVDADFMGTQITNVAQISDFEDANGDTPMDEDSTPNNDDGDQSEDDEDPETINLGQTFDLALIKEVSDMQALPVEPGEDVTFDISVINQGSLDATEVQISDYVPAGLILNDANWMMEGTTARLVVPIPSISSGSTEVVSITFTVDEEFQAASITNNAEIESAENILGAPDVDSPDYGDQDGSTPDPADDDITATDGSDDYDPAVVEIVQNFDLALQNVLVGPDTINAGETVTFNVIVYNQGSLDATSITVEDYLPSNTTLVPGGDFADDGSGIITSQISSLAAGEDTTISITVLIDPDFMGTVMTNNAEIISAINALGEIDEDNDIAGIQGESDDKSELPTNDDVEDDPDNVNDVDDWDLEQVFVRQTFDLALEKTLNTDLSDSQLTQGSTVVYDLIVSNEGTLDAQNVNVADNIPEGLILSDSNWTVVNGIATTTPIAMLNVGEDTTLQITFVIDDNYMGDEIINFAEITGSENSSDVPLEDQIEDNEPANDQDDELIMITQVFDLALIDTLIGAPIVSAGDTITFGISIYNQGTLDATDVLVKNYLPTGTSLVTGEEFFTLSDSIIAEVDFLAAGDSVQLIIRVVLDEEYQDTILINNAEIIDANNLMNLIDEDDPLNDHIGMSNDTTELDTDNNIEDRPDLLGDQDDYDPAMVAVNQMFDLALVKTIGQPTDSPLLPGGQVSFDIRVINQGTVDAYDVQVNDYIPDGLLLSDADWTEVAGIATLVVPIPFIGADSEETVTVTFTVDPDFEEEGIVNNAEIREAFDRNGSLRRDADSTPGDSENDDPDPDDNDENNTNGNDDFDPAVITIIQSASIGDTVWLDSNVNGIFDDGEIGVEGLVVNVLDTDGVIVGTSTTDANGFWIVEDIPNGDYQVQFLVDDLPGDYSITLQDQGGDDTVDSDAGQDGLTIFTSLDAGEFDSTWDLGIYQAASIGDQVWKDFNRNGIRDAGEQGVEGVIVTLQDCNGTFISETTTDLNGNYLFDGLVPGDYQLVFDLSGLPSGCEFTLPNQGSSEVDSDSDFNGLVACFTLDENEEESTIDVGLVTSLLNIGDFVWNDLDGDGIQDSGEPGIADVTVYLYNDNNDIVAVTTTNNAGQYIFENVLPDTYYLVFADPDGFSVSDPDQGDNNELDSDVTNFVFNSAGSTTDLFELIAGQEDDFSFDAGYYVCIPIGENVWYDVNENDVFDAVENGINGLKVNLYRQVNGAYVLYEQTTTGHKPGTPSDDGYYKFCVPPGTYYIEVEMPPIGLVQTVANVFGNAPINSTGESAIDSDLTNNFGQGTTAAFTVSNGDEVCNIGAGFYPMATIGNLVWFDENDNGIQDDDEERVSGVLVEAFNVDNEKVGESVTNSSGVYNIEYLQKQDYYLRFTPINGYGFVSPNQGDEDNDSDVSHSNGLYTTDLISTNPGDKIESIDAGMRFGVLPVEWLSITAEWRGDFNQVRWSTASEVKNDVFEIERRHESESEFSYIGELDAAGNSLVLNEYVFDDRDIDKAGRYYYRIKQVDIDGEFDYSATVFVTVANGDNTIKLFPNPSVGSTKLTIDMVTSTDVEISIFDVDGKFIRSITLTSDNTERISESITIDELPVGVYMIHVTQDEFKEVKKLIVVR